MMRILFVADGRSPIALNWIGYFVEAGHEVHLASTFACQPELALASLQVTPVAFSGLKAAPKPGALTAGAGGKQAKSGLWGAALVGARTRARQWFGPLTLPQAAKRLREVIGQIQPDLVHAMRIPYEGMLAALAEPSVPLLISIWGNDFTLHAPSSPLMRHYTHRALARADALHADCRRDLRLAIEWSYDEGKPGVVLPGAGGIQLDLFYPPDNGEERPEREHTVIMPRGFRAYVHNESFFKAIPRVLADRPDTHFLCPTMAGEAQVERWVAELGIGKSVELLPKVARTEMATLFRQARVVVSPTSHDGTPNTLLEALACGCTPVAGDIESLREWIEPGVNGLLVAPQDPDALAGAILQVLENRDLQRRAKTHNARLVAERADYGVVMQKAEEFYRELVAG